MTELLIQQTASMATTSPFSIFGLFSSSSTKPSRRGLIYSGMCQELEPERQLEMPLEAWNASVDPELPHQRYRLASDSSTTTVASTVASTPVKSPVYDVPKWSWPERKVNATHAPLSEPLKPQST